MCIRDSNLGWSASANAGGTSGEVGGIFARNAHTAAPFAGDVRSSVVPLNLNEILSFSGKFVLTNVNFDGSFGPCFFDTNTFGTTNFTFLAFRIVEPSSPGGPFRTSLRSFGPGPGSGAGSAVINVPEGVPASFQVTWQPSGLGNNGGIGTLTVVTPTSTNTVTHSYTAAVTFNAFGVAGLVHETGTPADPSKTCIAYFDDLIYSVPPSGAPQILKQPTAPAVVYAGNAFTMFAVAAGDAPLDYQWRKISGGVTNDVVGATNSSITFNPATLSDAGTYFLVASNGYNGGSVTNSALVVLNVQMLDITPSFAEASGKVVIEAEHYDRNWVVNNAAWFYDATWPSYSGEGYVASIAPANQSGNNWTTHPHLDYYVHFDNGGTWYLWLRGADVGIRRASVAVNGTVSSTASPVGNLAGAFGSQFSGTWTWCGFYSANPVNYAAISTPGPGNYVISVFMLNEGLLLDQILLTQDAGYTPGAPETETPASGSLGVKVATPSDATLVSGTLTNGQSLLGTGPKLVAASVLRGANPISKVEFYAGLVGSSSNKIGEAMAFPWQIMWTNYAIGTNVLTAKVTDSGGGTAMSANTVNAILTNNYVAPHTLPLYTNDFTDGAKTFTYVRSNGVTRTYTSDFGWRSTADAGGSAGEVGGLFLRCNAAEAQAIGVPLGSPVNFYFDGLWAAGTVVITNPTTLGSDGNIRIGYAASNSFGTDLSFNIQPPGVTPDITGALRLSPLGAPNIPAPYDAPFSFEVRWQPSPLGNGYLAKTKLVTSTTFGGGYAATQYAINSRGTPSTALNCFGVGSWGSASSARTNVWLLSADNLTYVVPKPRLQPSLSGNQITLKWPCSVPAYNLWHTPSVEGTPVWTQSGLPSPTFDASAGTLSVTQPADQSSRFYGLQY